MRTRQPSTRRHQRLILCALLLIVAVVVAILQTTRVTGSNVPAAATINLQTADASTISGSRSAYIAGANSGDRVVVFDQINDLPALIRSFNLPHGTERSLITNLRSGRSGAASACSSLNAFINQCQAEAGRKLTAQQAALLIAAATQMKTSTCPGIAAVSLVGTTAKDCKMQPSAPVNLARCI